MPFLVVRNVKEDAILTHGQAHVRTTAQTAAYEGYDNSRVITTAAGHAIQYGKTRRVSKEVPSRGEIMNFIEKNPIIESCADFCSSSSITSIVAGATAAVSYFIFQEIDKQAADKFFNDFKTRKTNSDAIADLIRKLDDLRRRKIRTDAELVLPMFFDAWNNMILKRPMKKRFQSKELPELLRP
jgi:hypothetical protein